MRSVIALLIVGFGCIGGNLEGVDAPITGSDATTCDSGFVLTDGSCVSTAPSSIMWSFPAGIVDDSNAIVFRSIPYDVKITEITFDYDFLQGGHVDYCLYIFRPAALPIDYVAVASYSEVLCFNPQFWLSNGHWHQDLDLSTTPLYLPADTNITCASSGGRAGDPATQGAHSCTIVYAPYLPGDPRYRLLRAPYQDTGYSPPAAFITSEFGAATYHPLHIKGFFLYDGVVNANYTACLQHLDGSSNLVAEHCLPRTAKTFSLNNGSRGLEPVDWTISAPDKISPSFTTDAVAPYGWDAAFYILAEVPPSFAVGPENAFRDYGNVPRPFLASYCNNWATNIATPPQLAALCSLFNAKHGIAAGTPCSLATLIDACTTMLYPPASCMRTDTIPYSDQDCH